MTPTEIEAMIENLNTRMSGIEQILPTLATKDDLKVFATKDDLQVFATKEDLKRFATKEDLREGLEATLSESQHSPRALFEDLKGDVGLLAEHLAHISLRLDHVARVVDRLDRRT